MTFDNIADGALRSTYLPWIESITLVKAGEEEELELRLNSNCEKIWRILKQRLSEPGVHLKSRVSSALAGRLWVPEKSAIFNSASPWNRPLPVPVKLNVNRNVGTARLQAIEDYQQLSGS
jgi:hypothetical protein